MKHLSIGPCKAVILPSPKGELRTTCLNLEFRDYFNPFHLHDQPNQTTTEINQDAHEIYTHPKTDKDHAK